MKKRDLLLMAATLVFTANSAFAADNATLPKGYEKWEKSKEKVVNDKNSLFYGIHNIYVDNKAMPVYKSGGTYPEGSRFVIDYYKIKDENGKPVKGKKNMVVMMKKDKKFKETGGWQFVGFTGEGKPSRLDPVKNCFECHLKEAKDTDYVMSKYSDFK